MDCQLGDDAATVVAHGNTRRAEKLEHIARSDKCNEGRGQGGRLGKRETVYETVNRTV